MGVHLPRSSNDSDTTDIVFGLTTDVEIKFRRNERRKIDKLICIEMRPLSKLNFDAMDEEKLTN